MALTEKRMRELALALAKNMARADSAGKPLVPIGFRQEVVAAFAATPAWRRPIDHSAAKNHERILRLRWRIWLDDQCTCDDRCDCAGLFEQPDFSEIADAIYEENGSAPNREAPLLRLATLDGARVPA